MSASYATHVMLHIQKKKMRILTSTQICGILNLDPKQCTTLNYAKYEREGLLRNDKNKVLFFISKFSLSTWSYKNRTRAPIHFIVYYCFELKICNMILGKWIVYTCIGPSCCSHHHFHIGVGLMHQFKYREPIIYACVCCPFRKYFI